MREKSPHKMYPFSRPCYHQNQKHGFVCSQHTCDTYLPIISWNRVGRAIPLLLASCLSLVAPVVVLNPDFSEFSIEIDFVEDEEDDSIGTGPSRTRKSSRTLPTGLLNPVFRLACLTDRVLLRGGVCLHAILVDFVSVRCRIVLHLR